MRTQLFAGIGLATAITAGASADFTAAMTNGYNVSVTDFFGNSIDLYVMDMYLMSDDANDVLLNVYNMNMSGPGTFYQAVASPTWTPSYAAGGPFDTDAAARGDSFVTIGTSDADISGGNPIQPGTNGTALDPNFGGGTAPGANAGWYTSDPAAATGAVTDTVIGQGVFIGRFAVETSDAFALSGSLAATWNQGLGTAGEQGTVDIIPVPAPGALALISLAGLAGLRGRRR